METNKNSGLKNIKLEPTYFYEENGKIVFTEEYHINRGYCCGKSCRHCPYEPKGVKGNTTTKK